MPKFSIVVVAYGKRAVTERCLESLERSLGEEIGRSIELVLVDNASPDDTAELFESWRDRATVILNESNLNFSGGNNAGARAATGDVLVFLNNDTEVRPGVLEALAEQALDPSVGAAGMRLLYPDGTLQHAGFGWRRSAGGTLLDFHLFRHEDGNAPHARATYDLDIVTAACLAMRRELFIELGGFDETYANGFEDVDLCVRTRLKGLRVVYRGDLAIVHHEGMSRSKVPDDQANRRVFMERYADLLEDDSQRLASLFGAGFSPRADQPVEMKPDQAGAPVTVEGALTTLGPEAEEARSLVVAFEQAGEPAAARDWPQALVSPLLTETETPLLTIAPARGARPDALCVHVPAPGAAVPAVGRDLILRIAALPAAMPPAAAVWAASPDLADAVRAAGCPADSVAWLPPFVPAVQAGPGGGGVLATVPVDDGEELRALVAALGTLGGTRVRILPRVASTGLERLAAELAPQAELLPPIASELAFAALAREADVLVAGDRDDAFQRRALLGAAGGAKVVAVDDGPAAAVLGDELLLAEPACMAEAVTSALAARGREERSSLVASTCGPAAIAERLTTLLADVRAARAEKRWAPAPAFDLAEVNV
jgi:GT2 family glycosyltransferase